MRPIMNRIDKALRTKREFDGVYNHDPITVWLDLDDQEYAEFTSSGVDPRWDWEFVEPRTLVVSWAESAS